MYQYLAGEESANPGPIDNANLFKNHTSDELKKDLMEYVDYSLIPKPAYDLLVSWYGLSRGSRHICRCVVAEFGIFVKCLIVEVYLCDLRLCIHPNINNIKLIPFSRADTVSELNYEISMIF
jgi:ubiquitin carboxyl-terminal hydrolase 4/11/15